MIEPADSVVAYVAIGSNIHPEENVPAAMVLLAEKVELMSISTFYRCQALGRPGQPDYRNGVAALRTRLSPRELIDEVLHPIEAQLGRRRTGDSYAARTIDLDLILYGDLVMHAEGIDLPDPEIRERAFVAAPLLELAPALVMPDDGARLADLPAARMTAELQVDETLSQVLKERVCYE